MRSNQNAPFMGGQSMGNQGNIPYAPPDFSNVPMGRQLTAEENIKRVVADVKAEKEKEKKTELEDYGLPKCDLHPKKLSNTCRKCKKLKEQIDEIEKKKKQEKEKSNPENRLREIFGESLNAAAEENKVKKNPNAPMAIWGDTSTFNINELLRNNIKTSPYFNEILPLRNVQEIIDEITKKATHAEPWLPGHVGIPSTFFCLLYRLMMLRPSEKQIKELIEYKENAYVRCIAFLFLRYCCNPDHIWEWFGKYILDEEEVNPTSNPDFVTTIGEFAESLLTDMNYHNTLFPRIPLVLDREIKKNILISREKRNRKRKNADYFDSFLKGAKVMAISPDDNDWHEATVVRIEGWRIRVKFTNLKEKHDDADFTLEFLSKKFQGEDVFEGGKECLVDLGEVMTPDDTREYLRGLGDLDAEEEKQEKPHKMQEEKPEKPHDMNIEEKDDKKEVEKKRKKSRSSSGSSSSSSSSRSRKADRKRKDRKRGDKHRSRRHKRSSSRSSSSDSSQERRRKRSSNKGRDKDRRRDRDRRSRRKASSSRSSSSGSSSSSESKERQRDKDRGASPRKPEKKKPEVKVKDKTDKYMEMVKQMEADSAQAHNKSDYAARAKSYKTSLSSVPGGGRGKKGRSRSREKEVIVVQQEGGRRRDKDEEKPSEPSKKKNNEASEKMKKLREMYGDVSKGDSKRDQRHDFGEGPDFMKLGS